jgi:hypothetical protein
MFSPVFSFRKVAPLGGSPLERAGCLIAGCTAAVGQSLTTLRVLTLDFVVSGCGFFRIRLRVPAVSLRGVPETSERFGSRLIVCLRKE